MAVCSPLVEGVRGGSHSGFNHTLKYGFEVAEGWKVVADNFQLRIEGDGVGHESVRKAIGKMASAGFWDEPDMRRGRTGAATRLSPLEVPGLLA